MKFIDDDDHFRKFTDKLAKEIDKYTDVNEKELLEFQKEQVERLVELETKFRQHIVDTGDPNMVYPKFIHHICETRRNILASRPFFRERQDVFTAHISDIFKRRDHEALKKFHFNFPFISLAINQFGCNKDPVLMGIYNDIRKLRIELVERNMPLAISRARIFWNKTPKAHLSYMDLVQIAAEGMLSAIDKYVLPFSSVFRSVAIGRMVGNFIENYSETTVHFFPVDKRKIYRANKVAHWYSTGSEVDYEQIANRVNEGIDQKEHHTTPSEIADLMQAASCVPNGAFGGVIQAREAAMDEESADDVSNEDAHDGLRPDVLTEQTDAYRALANAIQQLSIFEQKVLKLKGVQFFPTEVA
jgi:DNA-directed RNA polymerase specialized sigma subunit